MHQTGFCNFMTHLFDDIEVLDFCGPFEVFSAVRLNGERRREETSLFEVVNVAIAVNGGPRPFFRDLGPGLGVFRSRLERINDWYGKRQIREIL
jgi:hypothetical protein